jgi:hypothetical protein
MSPIRSAAIIAGSGRGDPSRSWPAVAGTARRFAPHDDGSSAMIDKARYLATGTGVPAPRVHLRILKELRLPLARRKLIRLA